MASEKRERVLYRNEICTVVARKAFGKLDLRDPFGRIVRHVPRKETETLDASDDRRTFST